MAYISFQPSDHFNTKLYTGNATDDTAITGVGFQPDWLWGKNRTDATNHYFIDAIRGVTKELNSNNADAEGTDATLIKSFDSDGFTLGNGSLNQSSKNFVSWNWLANGSGSANTDGSISSTVSANTTSGFSVVTYTGNSTAGATIGHGLGVAPEIVFYKSTTGAFDWLVYSKALGATKELVLNGTGAGTTSTVFNDTDPTSTNLVVNTNAGNNSSSHSYVAYCFAPKKGFSKFGSYTGNGSTDGTFVYTGFKPAFVLIKNYSDASQSWHLWDSTRSPSNTVQKYVLPNSSDAEGDVSSRAIDFLSNGFKPRGTSLAYNNSGSSFIYMAFAEHPLVSSNDIPATAR